MGGGRLPKTKGSGIMVSEFVEENGGFLKFIDAEFTRARESNPEITQSAQQLLEYGAEKEGYWTGDRFMKMLQIFSISNMTRTTTLLCGCSIKAAATESSRKSTFGEKHPGQRWGAKEGEGHSVGKQTTEKW